MAHHSQHPVTVLITGKHGDELTFECTLDVGLSLMEVYLGAVGQIVLEGGATIPVEDVKEITLKLS